MVVQNNSTEYGWATADGTGSFSTTVQIPLGVLTVNCTRRTCRDTGTVRVDAFQYAPTPQPTSAPQTLTLKTSPELTAVQVPDDQSGYFNVQVDGSGFTPGAFVGSDLYEVGGVISVGESPVFGPVQPDGTFVLDLEGEPPTTQWYLLHPHRHLLGGCIHSQWAALHRPDASRYYGDRNRLIDPGSHGQG